MRVAGSLWSVPRDRLVPEAERLAAAGLRRWHWDCSDGKFAAPGGFNPATAARIGAATGLPGEAHLMVVDPLAVVDEWCAVCDTVVVHVESTGWREAVERIAGLGRRAGVAISPTTPLDVLDDLVDRRSGAGPAGTLSAVAGVGPAGARQGADGAGEAVHGGDGPGGAVHDNGPTGALHGGEPADARLAVGVLVMSITPGQAGSRFLPETFDRLDALRSRFAVTGSDEIGARLTDQPGAGVDSTRPDDDEPEGTGLLGVGRGSEGYGLLGVDGGVTRDLAIDCARHGATWLVSGSDLCGSPNPSGWLSAVG